jgi:hypothetical protein
MLITTSRDVIWITVPLQPRQPQLLREYRRTLLHIPCALVSLYAHPFRNCPSQNPRWQCEQDAHFHVQTLLSWAVFSFFSSATSASGASLTAGTSTSISFSSITGASVSFSSLSGTSVSASSMSGASSTSKASSISFSFVSFHYLCR